MPTHAHREDTLHRHIVDQLVAQGWMLGESARYDAKNALYTEDVFAWLKETEPEKYKTLERQNGARTEGVILKRLLAALSDKRGGTLAVLRDGISIAGAGNLPMSVRQPQSEASVSGTIKYDATRLRVVYELAYSTANDNRIDIGLFVNGLPVATIEVKSNYTQNVSAAVEQYKKDRRPGGSSGRHQEPLLTFRRGALVHFAVSQDDVQMCTKLAGNDSYFLPFNRGREGGAGNDPFPGSLYPAAHLWMDALKPDTFLHIIHHLMLLERTEGDNGPGKANVRETMIFPRYHQLDVVRKLIAASAEEGPGQRYLIQHSAGSGKSKSIVWTAHGLTQLQVMHGARLRNRFDSVIIVTDRTVLDDQLSDELRQLKLDRSMIASIERYGSDSKSQKLADALTSGKRIIVVTLQTFPTAREIIASDVSLQDRNFAVIIDEAHSSTSGTTALNLRDALTGDSDHNLDKLRDRERVLELQKGRGLPKNVSFYAFTATPKNNTINMFGRVPDDAPAGQEFPNPEPFHVYTMQQAIEEGFILDVLKNYVSFDTVYRITLEDQNFDKLVRGRTAKREVAKWRNLHPTNVQAKVKLILEHFHNHVLRPNLLNGQAKAMIVTSSRAAAVAYHLALERMVQEAPQTYATIKSLVAFSEEVPNTDVKDPNFAEDHGFTERNLNPGLSSRSIPLLFEEDENKVLIVANKYQTGFDEPKLVAMYVDKPLSGVEAVQTLSRLNRTMKGKDQTFILDFANKDEEILRAFETYYKKAEIDAPQDASVVYDLQRAIYQQDIFTPYNVEAFLESFENGRPTTKSIAHHVAPCRDRYNDQLHVLNEKIADLEKRQLHAFESGNPGLADSLNNEITPLGEERSELEDFKRNLQRFGRLYTYISQIIFINDADLEAFHIFAKLLAKSIDSPTTETLDLTGLAMPNYDIRYAGELHGIAEPDETPFLRAASGEVRAGKHEEKTLLSQLLEQLSSQLELPMESIEALSEHVITQPMLNNETVHAQLKRNTNQQMLDGDFETLAGQALAASYGQYEVVVTKLFGDDALRAVATRYLLERMREGVNL